MQNMSAGVKFIDWSKWISSLLQVTFHRPVNGNFRNVSVCEPS